MLKKISISILVLLSHQTSLFGQRSYGETFRFTAQRVNLEEKVPKEEQLFFRNYLDAVVYFHGGDTISGKVNFNILLDELVHLDRRGREQVTAGQIDSVRFGNGVTFVFAPEQGFLERLEGGKVIGLYNRHSIKVHMEAVTQGPYGQPTRSAAVTRVRSLHAGAGPEGPDRDFYLENPEGDPIEVNVRYQSFFLFKKETEYLQVGNRRQLFSAFPEHRQEIRAFVRANPVSFSDPGDMKNLAAFIKQLYHNP